MRNITTRKVLRRGAVGAHTLDHTRRVNSRVAPISQPTATSTLGNLPPGTLLLDQYVVRSTLHPHETSVPGLFRCQSRDGRDVVLKVAPTQHPPKPDLWALLPQLDHPNIVPILEVLQRDGLYFEVQEFCEGGNLADCIGDPRINAEWIENHLAPQVNDGLKYLHAHGIVHRDIKPSNLYLRSNDLAGRIVLGDFDISSVLVSDRTSRHTPRMAGTWAYSAPEAFPRFSGDSENSLSARITRSADYYALGISIIELLTGTTSLHSCGLPDLYDFYLSGGRVELPDLPARMLLLLKGLLVRNRHERWNGPQVDRWLHGLNIREDMQAIINDQRFSLAKASKPFVLGSMQAVDLPSLALALEKNPEEAKSHLLESDLLTQWIANQDTAVAHKVERTRETYRHTPDLALFRCMMLCDPNLPLQIGDYGTIGAIEEWAPMLANKAATEKHLHTGPVSDLELSRLQAWLELKSEPAATTAARIEDIRHRPLVVRFEEVALLLDRKLKFSATTSAFLNLRRDEAQRAGGITPAEIVAEAFGPSEGWNTGVPSCFRTARDRWQQGYFETWLRQRGMADLATKAMNATALFQANIDEAFDVYLRHMDPWVDKPQLVFDEVEEPIIPCGAKTTVTLSFRTRGPGFPMGSVSLDGAPRHVTLDSYKILGRTGKITVGLHPKDSLMVGKPDGAFRLVPGRGNFWMENDGVEVRYHVVFALKETLLRAAFGMILGAALLGGARLFVSYVLGIRNVVTSARLVDNGPGPQIDPVAFIVGTVLCLGAIYAGYRAWLQAFVRSGR